LNPALEAAGVAVFETDLAELILQLGDDQPSHIVAPALHVNRSQVAKSSSAAWASQISPTIPKP